MLEKEDCVLLRLEVNRQNVNVPNVLRRSIERSNVNVSIFYVVGSLKTAFRIFFRD